jgi:hypothetical protein
LNGRYFVGKNCQANKRIAAQFLGNVQSILAQPTLTWWEGGDQTDFHYFLALDRPRFDEFALADVGYLPEIEEQCC